MKIKNKAAGLLSFILCVITFALPIITTQTPVYADGVSHDWYVMRNSDHVLPKVESRFEFIKSYDVIYGDENAAKNGDKVIYLTFDAGYENGNVAKILDVLKNHNAPGAFFVLENLVLRNPELIKRMANEGHLICNHTLDHPDMTKITDKARFENQLTSLNVLIKEKCGVECAKLYRPPMGRFSEENLQYATELGYKSVFWSFAYADWDNSNQPNKDTAIKKILDNVHPGEVMLLHPTSKTNAEILDTVLTMLEKDGYRFASLTDIKAC